MAELAYSLGGSLDRAADLPGLQAELDSFFRARRIPSSMLLITDGQGTIVASTHSDYINRPWAEVLPDTQLPQPDGMCNGNPDPGESETRLFCFRGRAA